MMKKALFFILLSFSTLIFAVEEQSSVGYQTLSPPQPTQNPAKIEVLEFFWYGCPHCYSLEPSLNAWLKTKPENVEYIRQPAAFSERWANHAKAYFTAEALGVVDKVHADFFDAIQNKQKALESESELEEFFVTHGVDKAKFQEAYNSFIVDTKLRQAKTMPARYGITGVPTLVINGKYVTSGPLAGSHENMIKILTQLIEQESKTMSAK